jgi:glycosyltransferase involved in cell wall biosynthesis
LKPASPHRLRYALIGDGESPHLLKWARALAPHVDLWLASSRGVLPDLAKLVPSWRTLALHTQPQHGGDNLGLIKRLPELARWLQEADADWINPHYLTSHGTLAWAAKRGWRLRGRLVGSAWGSDILVTPQRQAVYRWVTQRVLRACALATSDSQHMAARMRELGAGEVLVFPFGLDRMPPPPPGKQPWLFYANRGLEPLYQPQRLLEVFAAVAAVQPEARLVVANDGALRPQLQAWVLAHGLAAQVQFTGRLDADAQNHWYARAQWFVSLPQSDSVAVSVLEAMAHGCIPLLSDLPANRELVEPGRNGLVLADGAVPQAAALQALLQRAGAIAGDNRAWVKQHGLFAPAIQRLLVRLQDLTPRP